MNHKQGNEIESEISITLVFENPEVAQTVNQATAPENLESPENVSVTSYVKGNTLCFKIKSLKSFNKLLTTIEDYFDKIDLSYKTIKELKKQK